MITAAGTGVYQSVGLSNGDDLHSRRKDKTRLFRRAQGRAAPQTQPRPRPLSRGRRPSRPSRLARAKRTPAARGCGQVSHTLLAPADGEFLEDSSRFEFEMVPESLNEYQCIAASWHGSSAWRDGPNWLLSWSGRRGIIAACQRLLRRQLPAPALSAAFVVSDRDGPTPRGRRRPLRQRRRRSRISSLRRRAARVPARLLVPDPRDPSDLRRPSPLRAVD